MCLIAIAPKGTDKYSEFFLAGLRESGSYNRDGFGYGFKKENNDVFYEKGFMNIELLIDAIKKRNLTENDELVVHLRMRSAGKICAENTHPFVVNYSSKDECPVTTELKKTVHPIMFHNGTFSDFSGLDGEMSDTYSFVNKFIKLKPIWVMLRDHHEKFISIFKDILSHNRLVFLSKTSPMIKIGAFTEDEGYIFSNLSYRNYRGNAGYHDNSKAKAVVDKIMSSASINNNTDNLTNISIEPHNFQHFILKVKENSNIGTVKLKQGDFFIIKKYTGLDRDVIISNLSVPANFAYVDISHIDHLFTKMVKADYKKMYIDYTHLKQTVNITKSGIKKLYSKMLSCSNSKKIRPKIVSLKLAGNKGTCVDYEAAIMFLDEVTRKNPNFINMNMLIHGVLENTKVDNHTGD